MNSVFTASVRFALTGVLLAIIPGIGNAACSLNAGYTAEPPYHYPDNDGNIIGIDADILRIVLGDIGCGLTFEILPWKRTLSQIKAGRTDTTMGASFKEDRAKFAYYSIPYRGQPHVIAFKKSANVVAGSLEEYLENGQSLGVVLGWHYTNEIRALLDAPQFQGQIFVAPKFELLLKMHEAQRFLGFLTNPSVLAGFVGGGRLKTEYDMVRADIDILHFLFSKKTVSEDIARRFNSRLKEKLGSGFFFEVCENYENQLVSGCKYLSTK